MKFLQSIAAKMAANAFIAISSARPTGGLDEEVRIPAAGRRSAALT